MKIEVVHRRIRTYRGKRILIVSKEYKRVMKKLKNLEIKTFDHIICSQIGDFGCDGNWYDKIKIETY